MKNKKSHQSISGGFHRHIPALIHQLCEAWCSCAHSSPLGLNGFWWNWNLETELRITGFTERTRSSKSVFCGQEELRCPWRQSRGQGWGRQDQAHLTGPLPTNSRSRIEIGTGSCPSIRGQMSLLDHQLHFSSDCCLMYKVYFTSKQERNFSNELQCNSTTICWAPRCQVILLYVDRLADKRWKTKSKSRPALSSGRKTQVLDSLF